MGKFQVIAGSGHCGTMWLATVLDCNPEHRWVHEMRTTVTGMPWQEADTYAPNDPVFDTYWERVWAALFDRAGLHGKSAVFGDSNSWPPESLPSVNEVVGIDRVIYLTRDKERQLYSLLNHSPVWCKQPEHWPETARRRIDLYAEISGKPRDAHLLVDANDFMPGWLRSHGLTVDVYSLEELTTDVDRLRELAPLSDDVLRAWQKQDINKKVYA